MEYEKIMNIIGAKKRGSFIRLRYKTEPDMAAAARDMKINVVKITEATVRFGVCYSNIKKVKAQRTEDAINGVVRREVTPWWTWKHEYIIKEHVSKNKLYLSCATIAKGSNTKSQWFVNGMPKTKEEIQAMGIVINSYWNRPETSTFDLDLNNIIDIIRRK